MDKQKITRAALFSPRIQTLLDEMGITTAIELREKGAFAVFLELKARSPGLTQATLWRLWAWEQQISLKEVTPEVKNELRHKLAALPAFRSFPPQSQMEVYMSAALEEAKAALGENEVPIGAVVVAGDKIIGRGHNRTLAKGDITAHAEIEAIRDASGNCGNHRLTGCSLYVTLEPCLMCLGAVYEARLDGLIYGAKEPKTGALASHPVSLPPYFKRRVAVLGGVLAPQTAALMTSFFAAKRGDNAPIDE